MSFSSRLTAAARSLMGVSVYAEARPFAGPEIDSEQVERVRMALGGQLQPLPISQTRWLMADLETAQKMADSGDMTKIGQLSRAMRRDGVISGLTKTRTSGLVALPKRFRGSPKLIEMLQAEVASRSVFDEMMPPSELAAFTADFIKLGVGVAELVPVKGRDYPVMVRLEPEFLRWRQSEGRWYFQSIAGAIPITPGDGKWMLITAGRNNPWQAGDWHALGRAFITKEHAMLGRSNFSRALANPARVAHTMKGATDLEQASIVQKLIAWGYSTAFALPEGWDIKLIESNGRGWEVFGTEIEASNNEVMIALCGQIVTVTGGSGFANADIHRTIRADLIKETGDALAHCINTQVFPPWALAMGESLEDLVRVSYDTAPPQDREVEAKSLGAIAGAIVSLSAAVAASGEELDVIELLRRFGVPITGKKIAPPTDVVLSTTDVKATPEPPEPAPEAPSALNSEQAPSEPSPES